MNERREKRRLSANRRATREPVRRDDSHAVEWHALSGNDWGAEAQPKLTEFGTVGATRAMVAIGFDKLV